MFFITIILIDFLFIFLVLGKRNEFQQDVKFLGRNLSSYRLIGEKFLIDINDITKIENDALNLSTFVKERQKS